MIESQLSICTWADATFGPPVSDASIAARALVEMAELVTACVYGRPAEEIGEEIADVVIVLARLGRSLREDAVSMATTCTAPPEYFRPATWLASRAAEHLAQLIRDIDPPSFVSARIMLRVAVTLGHLALALRLDLPAAIDRKMAINRARRWHVDGNGHGEHVKEGL